MRRICAAAAVVLALATVTAPAHGEPTVNCEPNVPSAVDMGVTRTVIATAVAMGASPKVILAAVEAGLVESNLNNCANGDRDSVGVFQQRPSWGSFAQRTDVAHASRSFLVKAIARENRYSTAGRLAQAVQASAFPYRYDTRERQAQTLIAAVRSAPDGTAGPLIAEGSFVSFQGSHYRIAGGAPIFVSDWSHLGGNPGNSRPLGNLEWSRLRQYPAEGTVLSGSDPDDPKHGTNYVVASGAAIPRSDLSADDTARMIIVDLAAIRNAGGSGVWGHLKSAPATGAVAVDDNASASQVPTAIGAPSASFPARRIAVVSWAAPANVKYYRVRISQANSTRRWRSLVALTRPSARYGALRRGATYRIEITPVGPGGTGPTTTWKFTQKR
jgi:hypothetical protein